jgi:Flp pilus assembly protein TadG
LYALIFRRYGGGLLEMASSKRRLKSKAGNVAMIFALAAVPATIAVGSGIEWSRITSAKAKLDRATDAAVLMAKKEQIENRAQGTAASQAMGEAAAQKAFAQNAIELAEVADNEAITITWDADGAARGIGAADATLVFGGVLGMNTAHIEALAVATSGADSFIEIAMVLDNTGSMFAKDGRPKTRFTLMREAATSFVNSSFDRMTQPSLLRFAVVPFGTTVNVKSEEPGTWDNSAAPAGTVADYGSRSMPVSTISRSGEIVENPTQLAAMFAPVEWRGCISGNGETQLASDAPKAAMQWNALNVPAFPQSSSWKPIVDVPGTCQSCTGTRDELGENELGTGTEDPPVSPPPPVVPPPATPPPPKGKGKNAENRLRKPQAQFAAISSGPKSAREARFLTFGRQQSVAGITCVNVPCTQQQCDPNVTSWEAGTNCTQTTMKGYGPEATTPGRRNTFIKQDTQCWTMPDYSCTATKTFGALSTCIGDPNEFGYNNSGGAWCSWVPATTWEAFDDSIGPNVNCPMPMLGLSGSRPQVLATINRMSPVVGGTHNDVGLRWGLRALSPRTEWTNFFGNPGSKAPLPFVGGGSKKAMVLITDGENTEAEDFPGFWGCSDTTAPGCTGAPTPDVLDQRMLDWCQAIRTTYGVEIYTVAVNITDTDAINKLAQCAGDPARAFTVDASALGGTLDNVARSIFQLRLTE